MDWLHYLLLGTSVTGISFFIWMVFTHVPIYHSTNWQRISDEWRGNFLQAAYKLRDVVAFMKFNQSEQAKTTMVKEIEDFLDDHGFGDKDTN